MYTDLVDIRDVDINGESNWYWVKGDTGCFGNEADGPMRDWLSGHSTKYFEHLKNYDTIVTGGTSCGMHARFYAKMFKHVYAFEPDPLSFHCMVNNCQSDNVYKLNAALGHGNGLVGLFRAGPGGSDMNIGMNQITNTNQFKIPMMSIDSLNLDSCDMIQLDVEGFESRAIEGATNTIEKFKPIIVAERFESVQNQQQMRKLGYTLSGSSFLDAIYIYDENINRDSGIFHYTS